MWRRYRPRPQSRPGLPDTRDELPVVVADLRFETPADLARERGALAARGHRDLEIAAPEDGRQDEVTRGRTIHDVDESPDATGRRRHRVVHRADPGGRDDERTAPRVVAAEAARAMLDAAGGGERVERCCQRWAHDHHARAGIA